jgi:predicted outer membrane repeat protein
VTNSGDFHIGPGAAENPTSLPFMFNNITPMFVEGGAINNSGTATITGSSFSENTVGNPAAMTNAGVHDGGAIANSGAITITGSSFVGNQAFTITVGTGNGGGGAILNEGTAKIFGSSFANNSAGIGGAIINTGTAASLTIANSVFTLNNTMGPQGFGGAISNGVGGTGGSTTITNSIFENNTAATNGGAISNSSGSMMITGGDK